MTTSAKYICKECKCSYGIELGIIDSFLPEYEKLIGSVKRGDYGEEWQQAFNQIIEVAIDTTMEVFECPVCHSSENAKDLNLYIPRDPQALERIRSAKVTVDRWGQVRPVIRHDLKNCYRLYKQREHTCPKCKSAMEKVDISLNNYSYPCPKCGTSNTPQTVQK